MAVFNGHDTCSRVSIIVQNSIDNFDKLMLLALIENKADFTNTSLMTSTSCLASLLMTKTSLCQASIKLGKGATKRTCDGSMKKISLLGRFTQISGNSVIDEITDSRNEILVKFVSCHASEQ